MAYDFGAFIGKVLWTYWTLISGVVLMAEPMAAHFWGGYDAWATRYISAASRGRAARWSALLAFVAANFLAYH